MNRKMITKFSNFVLGNGFYIALALCIAVIGLSGHYLMNSVTKSPTIVAPVTGSIDLTVPEPENVPVIVPEVVKPLETPEPEAPAEVPVEQISEEIIPEELEETIVQVPVSYGWPSEGQLTQVHSMDALVFNATMGDWRTHAGIDITAPEGTAVFAVASGEVTDVYHDDMSGTTVVIAHGDDMESSYGNLGEFPSVEVGNIVECGDIIAVIGQSALSEASNPPHLQLTMTQGGNLVDPLDFLPEPGMETMATFENSMDEENLH